MLKWEPYPLLASDKINESSSLDLRQTPSPFGKTSLPFFSLHPHEKLKHYGQQSGLGVWPSFTPNQSAYSLRANQVSSNRSPVWIS